MVSYSAEDVVKFISEQNPLKNPKFYRKNYPDKYSAACRRLGSWGAAVNTAGRDYYSSLKCRPTQENDLVRIITRRVSLKRDINIFHMHYFYPWLPTAVKRKYGDYYALIEKCGINPESVHLYKKWSYPLILCELKEYIKQGHDAPWLRNNDSNLYNAAVREFKSIDYALAIVRHFEEQELFNRIDELKQIQNYKERIAPLHEGRTAGKHFCLRDTKKISPKILNQKLTTLEDYLKTATDFVTSEDIKAATGLQGKFLTAATPTRTTDCIKYTDLIGEMEKEYTGSHWTGNRFNKIYYYHMNNAKTFKRRLAVKHLKMSI